MFVNFKLMCAFVIVFFISFLAVCNAQSYQGVNFQKAGIDENGLSIYRVSTKIHGKYFKFDDMHMSEENFKKIDIRRGINKDGILLKKGSCGDVNLDKIDDIVIKIEQGLGFSDHYNIICGKTNKTIFSHSSHKLSDFENELINPVGNRIGYRRFYISVNGLIDEYIVARMYHRNTKKIGYILFQLIGGLEDPNRDDYSEKSYTFWNKWDKKQKKFIRSESN